MSTILPSLGRGGLINTVRKLNGTDVPGYKDVDSSTTFMAGQVATLAADSNGNPVLKAITSNTEKPIGILFCHKALSFYAPVVAESAVAPAAAGTIALAHPLVKSGSVRVVNSSTGTAYTLTTNYTVNLTNGVITNVNIPENTPLAITYLYQDSTQAGVDQTLGSGKAAYISDPCEIATIVYDSSVAYTLGAVVYSTTDGYISSADPGGSSYTLGTVTKVPSADDPELWVRVRIA